MSLIRGLVLLLGVVSCWSTAIAQDVVLIANKSVQITEIKDADLRAIFKGEKTRFADGSHAVPVTLKGGPLHDVFLRTHLGSNPHQFPPHSPTAVFPPH